MSEPVLMARALTKVYRTGEVEVHALRGVDLDLYEGEFVVMLGPSGSGKSTLLNLLGGLDVYRGRRMPPPDCNAGTTVGRTIVSDFAHGLSLTGSTTQPRKRSYRCATIEHRCHL